MSGREGTLRNHTGKSFNPAFVITMTTMSVNKKKVTSMILRHPVEYAHLTHM